jgi:hypothetical protein
MRQLLSLLVVLALLMTAACVEEYTPETNATAVQTPVATTAAAHTPAATPAPLPVAVAYISGITCGQGDKLNPVYHCGGDVRVQSGASYENVQVITMFADKNTFRSNIVSLGGSGAIAKPFIYFPDLKYKGQNPGYFVRLDDLYCPVTWNGNIGVAMTNMTVPDGVKNPR